MLRMHRFRSAMHLSRVIQKGKLAPFNLPYLSKSSTLLPFRNASARSSSRLCRFSGGPTGESRGASSSGSSLLTCRRSRTNSSAHLPPLIPQLRPDQSAFIASQLGAPIDKKAYAIRRKKKKPEDEEPAAAPAAPPAAMAGLNEDLAGSASGSTSRMPSLHSSPQVAQTDQLHALHQPFEDGSAFQSLNLDRQRTSTIGSATSGQFR